MTTKIVNQHYVSRALIARFSQDPRKKNGPVGQTDVTSGRVLPARPPGSVGFERHFVKFDGDRMESLWATVEGPMAEVFAALLTGRPESLRARRPQVNDFVALHFARSLEAQRIHATTLSDVEARTRANTEMQTKLANLKYGLDLAQAPSILEGMADTVLEPIRALEEQGVLFQQWIEEVFQKTRTYVTNFSLSIRPAPSGTEYLLGDCPAIGIAPGMDPRIRPPLVDSKALILPLTPRFAAMVYPAGRGEPEFSVEAPDPVVVTAVNHGQISLAHRRVFYRPGSGHEATVRNYLGFGDIVPIIRI